LVFADDCQDLDEQSAGLLSQLVAGGAIVTVATVRSGTHTPQSLADLWKDGLAERIELQNLSLRETTELLATSLGGRVQDSSASRMWQVTEGNPLYLREVLLSSQETGALREIDGEWSWRGEWATGSRIMEIVATRLGRLDPDETDVMEMLAVAGSLPLDLVAGLTSTEAIERLERSALLSTERSGRRLEVAIGHPLHAEVLRSQMPTLHQRAIRRNLVEALNGAGGRRAEDQVRIACWSIESGLEVDPMTLALGTDAALFGIAHAIAARLHEVFPDAAPTPPTAPAVPHDEELAVRLAEAAYDRSGGIAEGAALASALVWIGAFGRSEQVLAELEEKAGDVDDRLRVAAGLGRVRFWGSYNVEEATHGLESAAAAGEAGDPALLADVYEELAGIAVNTAQPAMALLYAEQAATVLGVELSQCPASPAAAAAIQYLGRCQDAIDFIDRAVPAAHDNGHPLAVAALLFTRAAALSRMGDLEEARELGAWLRDVSLSRELLDATATFGVLLGEIMLRQGRPASAGRMFSDASGLLSEGDVLGYRPWALAGLARARALCGHQDAAVAALDEARRLRRVGRHYDIALYLAEADIHRVGGRTQSAVCAARNGSSWAHEAGMVIDEAFAVDMWFRIEPGPGLAERLWGLAATTDSALVRAMADFAQATCARDADGLLEVANAFASMTAWSMAAEAAAGAEGILQRDDLPRAAKAAARTASEWAGRCEGSLSSVGSLPGSTHLTKREREIATLAATGISNKEIAERMVLSSRTVANHLYNAYAKLGVSDRADLDAALGNPGPSE